MTSKRDEDIHILVDKPVPEGYERQLTHPEFPNMHRMVVDYDLKGGAVSLWIDGVCTAVSSPIYIASRVQDELHKVAE